MASATLPRAHTSFVRRIIILACYRSPDAVMMIIGVKDGDILFSKSTCACVCGEQLQRADVQMISLTPPDEAKAAASGQLCEFFSNLLT
jgi:hypothetical protein